MRLNAHSRRRHRLLRFVDTTKNDDAGGGLRRRKQSSANFRTVRAPDERSTNTVTDDSLSHSLCPAHTQDALSAKRDTVSNFDVNGRRRRRNLSIANELSKLIIIWGSKLMV